MDIAIGLLALHRCLAICLSPRRLPENALFPQLIVILKKLFSEYVI